MSEGVFIANDSRWRIAATIVLSLGFVWVCAIFAGLLVPVQGLKRQIVGWLGLVFFGALSVGLLPRLFHSKVRVKISSRGMYSRSWSDDTIPWSEISRISVWGDRNKSHFILLYLERPDRFPPSTLGAYFSKANALFGVRADVWIGFALTDRRIDEALSAIDRFQQARESVAAPVQSSGFGRRRL